MGFLLTQIPFAYRFAAIALLAAAFGGWCFVKGVDYEQARFEAYRAAQEKAVLVQVNKAATATANLQIGASALEEVSNEKQDAITARLNRALAELRQRPDRVADVPQGSTACVGNTGAQLAGPDAGFLEGYAADAARLRVAVDRCSAQYKQLAGSLEEMRAAAAKAAASP
jgi:hypothetical protein